MSPAKTSEDLYQRGLAFFRAGNYQRCLDTADQALAIDPDDGPWLLLKGTALVELGQSDEAIAVLRQATQAAPENPEAWRQLGLALLAGQEYRATIDAFRVALRLQPEDVSLLIDLGNVLFTLGHVEEAIQSLEKARSCRQGDLVILRNLEDIYTAASRHEQALQTTHDILELRPDDVLAHCDAAWLNLRLQRLDESANHFQALRHIDSEHELYAVHGLVMTEIHRRNWRRALDLAIAATRLDRYEFTTKLLAFISGRLFGKTGGEITLGELDARFEAEHAEHRRLHAEGMVTT